MVVPGSVHRVIDEQGYNDGTQNNHPIGNLSASYRCFPPKPFHDFHPWLDRTQLALYLSSVGGFFVGFRVRMQPQTMNAVTIAQKIQSCICGIVVFSVAQHHYEPL